MDVAVRLIVETNDKSYEIGEKVGYLDANYFSYVFKRNLEYLRQNTENHQNRNVERYESEKTERKSTKKGI